MKNFFGSILTLILVATCLLMGGCAGLQLGGVPSPERQAEIEKQFREKIAWEKKVTALEEEEQKTSVLRSEQRRKALEAKNAERLASVRSVYDFHRQCEEFGTDVVGRAEAGCSLTYQQKLELDIQRRYPRPRW